MGTDKNPVIAVTSGEPAGIGPDICLDLATAVPGARLVALGSLDLLRQRAARLGKAASLRTYDPARPMAAGILEVLDLPLRVACEPGRLDPRNSAYVLGMIDRAYDGCVAGEFGAMVTAPVSKAVINDAGTAFTGHTEYLAARAGGVHVVMMLVGGGLKVALATTHLALQEVPGAITQPALEQTLRVLVAGLRTDFGVSKPRVLVSGLNPHGGEDGHLGREEIDVIRPVIRRLRAEGMDLSEPLPADTLFNPERLRAADCVLAMYHDQGLPVLKFASFGSGVNVTLGLPVIRTSVDHGTALDIAGSGKAESGSLVEAVQLAVTMINARAQNSRR
ncbi:MAG: 4-hydroxythreonine-4-phosphate dehydrogenase PdxA [Betaproteobacteria bacterium RIFCSPLOWO2_02_FULL_62_17]|nr:MAG: 4-hydroxythreonine-4-phosphate dehydrogenase PdxA [Betaproteobacteria bacterium RIFCSPLOWO2_02_FULL_62_17]